MKKQIFRNLEALFNWSVQRRVGTVRYDGDKISVEVGYRNRYWSPVYWLMGLVFLPIFLLKGGLIEWVVHLFSYTSMTRRFEGTFKPEASWWKRRFIVWRMIYTDL